ncbi:hypothetical protein WMY93_005077 [Mugilogobius chulae]|uniref:Uncharacterized protein n=1 Tax=Mugilogobius chulae TaxID=88201 RepID=A0AAW0Q135_9GOBI
MAKDGMVAVRGRDRREQAGRHGNESEVPGRGGVERERKGLSVLRSGNRKGGNLSFLLASFSCFGRLRVRSLFLPYSPPLPLQSSYWLQPPQLTLAAEVSYRAPIVSERVEEYGEVGFEGPYAGSSISKPTCPPHPEPTGESKTPLDSRLTHSGQSAGQDRTPN